MKVYPQAENKFIVKLESVKIGSIDQRIPFPSQNRILPVDMFDPASISPATQAELEKPFEIQRRDGKVVFVDIGIFTL